MMFKISCLQRLLIKWSLILAKGVLEGRLQHKMWLATAIKLQRQPVELVETFVCTTPRACPGLGSPLGCR